jgi:hypothetical protein
MSRTLLTHYPRQSDRFDEMLDDDGQLRPSWRVFFDHLDNATPGEMCHQLDYVRRRIQENGVTYNVYADPKGADRPWELDPLPMIPVDPVIDSEGLRVLSLFPQGHALVEERRGDPLAYAGRSVLAEAALDFVIDGDFLFDFALFPQGHALVEERPGCVAIARFLPHLNAGFLVREDRRETLPASVTRIMANARVRRFDTLMLKFLAELLRMILTGCPKTTKPFICHVYFIWHLMNSLQNNVLRSALCCAICSCIVFGQPAKTFVIRKHLHVYDVNRNVFILFSLGFISRIPTFPLHRLAHILCTANNKSIFCRTSLIRFMSSQILWSIFILR